MAAMIVTWAENNPSKRLGWLGPGYGGMRGSPYEHGLNDVRHDESNVVLWVIDPYSRYTWQKRIYHVG
jgi:hypothetical protein